MPLFDHFHPPVEHRLPWDSLHSAWATYLATALNMRWLTQEFIALEHTRREASAREAAAVSAGLRCCLRAGPS
jgi:hypothetical protein